MRSMQWIIVTAIIGTPALAAAQTPTQSTAQTTTQTTAVSSYYPENKNWTVSGFVGSNFGAQASSASVDFGGQLSYLWGGVAGAELIADFAPDFKVSNAFLTNNPDVNAYMLNAIAAIPIGSTHRVQPYASGGFGGIRADVRYFSALHGTNIGTNTTAADVFAQNLLSGLDFWRANIGVAFRW